MAGMPSFGGPPERISLYWTVCLLKSVVNSEAAPLGGMSMGIPVFVGFMVSGDSKISVSFPVLGSEVAAGRVGESPAVKGKDVSELSPTGTGAGSSAVTSVPAQAVSNMLLTKNNAEMFVVFVESSTNELEKAIAYLSLHTLPNVFDLSQPLQVVLCAVRKMFHVFAERISKSFEKIEDQSSIHRVFHNKEAFVTIKGFFSARFPGDDEDFPDGSNHHCLVCTPT